jgi:hypothetical protein
MCVTIARSVQLARAGDAPADAEPTPIRCSLCYDGVDPVDWAVQSARDAICHIEHVAFDPRAPPGAPNDRALALELGRVAPLHGGHDAVTSAAGAPRARLS